MPPSAALQSLVGAAAHSIPILVTGELVYQAEEITLEFENLVIRIWNRMSF